jgi:hypothetical protein
MLHQRQHLDGASSAPRATGPRAGAGLGDLLADGVDRVERGHRLLEDDGRSRGRGCLPSRRRSGTRSRPCHRIWPATMRPGGIGDQLQDRHRGHGLAAAGLADHAQRLAACRRQVDAVDGCTMPSSVLKWVLSPRISSSGHAGEHRDHPRGSSASRRPSPMKLMASTARKIAPPGNSAQCGRCRDSPWRRTAAAPGRGYPAESRGRGTTASIPR